MRAVVLTLLLAACSDYEIKGTNPHAGTTPTTSTPTAGTPGGTPTGTPAGTPPGTTGGTPTWPATVPCTGFDPNWQWWGSPPFDTQADRVDPAGVPFWDPAHQLVDYSTIVLPERNIPVGFDKAFVAWFDLPDPAPQLHLELQSDDGIWVWVNGVSVGHWGGDWQQEGCVNDNANCVESVVVLPVDVSSYVQPGANVIAARVTNPVMNSWFEVLAVCIE